MLSRSPASGARWIGGLLLFHGFQWLRCDGGAFWFIQWLAPMLWRASGSLGGFSPCDDGGFCFCSPDGGRALAGLPGPTGGQLESVRKNSVGSGKYLHFCNHQKGLDLFPEPPAGTEFSSGKSGAIFRKIFGKFFAEIFSDFHGGKSGVGGVKISCKIFWSERKNFFDSQICPIWRFKCLAW